MWLRLKFPGERLNRPSPVMKAGLHLSSDGLQEGSVVGSISSTASCNAAFRVATAMATAAFAAPPSSHMSRSPGLPTPSLARTDGAQPSADGLERWKAFESVGSSSACFVCAECGDPALWSLAIPASVYPTVDSSPTVRWTECLASVELWVESTAPIGTCKT